MKGPTSPSGGCLRSHCADLRGNARDIVEMRETFEPPRFGPPIYSLRGLGRPTTISEAFSVEVPEKRA